MGAHRQRRTSLLLTGILAVLLDLVAFVPRLVFENPTAGGTVDRPATRATVPGIAYELVLLYCLLALTAGTRLRRPARVAAVVLFAAFLVFAIYHEAYMRYVFLAPAIVDDWRLLLNLYHFLRVASPGWRTSMALWALGYVGAIALAAWTFSRVQCCALAVSLRTRAIVTIVFALVGGAAVKWVKRPPLNAIIQPVGDGVAANIHASRLALASWDAIFGATPDTRYDAFSSLKMKRKPNVYLLMIEAYGELLATCPSRTAYQDLLRRVGARLEASGFHARSGYSTAPIYGARSWLSMASVQTGIHIELQPAYRVLEKTIAKVPTLTKLMKAQGYYTLMLQPLDAPRVGVTSEDIYQRDRTVIRADLPYQGKPYGLAGVPDQYSLRYFETHQLQAAPSPRFTFYMATTTHFDWWEVPPFVRDYTKLDTPPVRDEDLQPWPPLDGKDRIEDPLFARYFAEVEYEWRVLADFIDARRDEDALIIVLGDHQPTRLECAGSPVTFNTPIHVVSKDPSLVDAFADVGLVAGWYAEPGQKPPLKHEAMFSLLVSKLAGGAYAPDGASMSGLGRR